MSVLFCFATWAVWLHYQTVTGPVALATVVSKEARRHKGSYDYYLTVRFVHKGLQVATSQLEVTKGHYPDFRPGDIFPITYARTSPEDTAFAGAPFFVRSVAIGYGLMALLLVFLFRAMRQENQPAGRYRHPPKRRTSGRHAAAAALAWAGVGAIAFSGGIISCRHSALATKAAPVAYEYQDATLLRVEYSGSTRYASALLQLPAPASQAPVRLSLSPEQHALLQARLSRPHTGSLQVPVAYLPATPHQVLLADTSLGPPAADTDSPLGISYNMLGCMLIAGGLVLIVVHLMRYSRRAED
ncbi:DUF3592 domain-containing protein [Hymenobacter sp. APR13]|uniref:DUF3592 domain-containing protein n=1 Tax=Hymenobacter sp. APR13 TaxID=1356852 RepID=UPI0012DFF9BA|nr:DUF3592 domain-containing protein [Hymenobacter sp. APR13]